MGLIAAQGFENPLGVLIAAFPFNFYPMLALAMVLVIIFTQKDFGPMKEAERRAREEGKLLNDGATPMISSEHVIALETKEGVEPKAYNMILPIFTMVSLCMMPLMLVFTGLDQVENIGQYQWYKQIFFALGKGSGLSWVLYSVLMAITVGIVLYTSKKVFTFKETIDLIFKGISGLIPLACIHECSFCNWNSV